MFGAIVINFALPSLPRTLTFSERMIASLYSDWYKLATITFFGIFFILMSLGMCAAEAPYVISSKVFTTAYFLYFILVLPFLSRLTNGLSCRPARA
jgi:quinol-cytochrome oxidoreductase complex cytochrome b subunit